MIFADNVTVYTIEIGDLLLQLDTFVKETKRI